MGPKLTHAFPFTFTFVYHFPTPYEPLSLLVLSPCAISQYITSISCLLPFPLVIMNILLVFVFNCVCPWLVENNKKGTYLNLLIMLPSLNMHFFFLHTFPKPHFHLVFLLYSPGHLQLSKFLHKHKPNISHTNSSWPFMFYLLHTCPLTCLPPQLLPLTFPSHAILGSDPYIRFKAKNSMDTSWSFKAQYNFLHFHFHSSHILSFGVIQFFPSLFSLFF